MSRYDECFRKQNSYFVCKKSSLEDFFCNVNRNTNVCSISIKQSMAISMNCVEDKGLAD